VHRVGNWLRLYYDARSANHKDIRLGYEHNTGFSDFCFASFLPNAGMIVNNKHMSTKFLYLCLHISFLLDQVWQLLLLQHLDQGILKAGFTFPEICCVLQNKIISNLCHMCLSGYFKFNRVLINSNTHYFLYKTQFLLCRDVLFTVNPQKFYFCTLTYVIIAVFFYMYCKYSSDLPCLFSECLLLIHTCIYNFLRARAQIV
jgi:hypothetical protein